jgi:iron complex outermembrane recepter protein
MTKWKLAVSIPVVATALVSASAFAQEAADVATGEGELEEIVVVAQKRSEPLQDVPVAVGVVSGENVDRLNITNLSQLSSYVPNLTVTDTASGNRITMRGISSGTNRGFEQSVGMFVDGVYAGRALQFSVPFYDVERVEVLRGPQGVLFGKNTVAGAISVITTRPTDESFISLSGSNEVRFGENQLSGIANHRLSDNLRVRVSGRMSRSGNEFLYNANTGNQDQSRDQDLARISIAWEPSADMRIDAKYEYGRVSTSGGRFQAISQGTSGALFRSFDPRFETNLDRQSSTGNATRSSGRLRSHNAALRIQIPVGEGQVVAQSGYSGYRNTTLNEDSDFTPVPLIFFDNSEKFDQFSEELRYESPSDKALYATLGLYYQNNHYVGQPVFRFFGGPVRFPNTGSRRLFDQRSDTYSAFGELTYRITPELRITGGLRYSAEDKRANRSLVVIDPVTRAPITSAALLGFTRAALAAQNFSNSQSVKERQTTPAATIQYDITPDVMAYGRFSRGNKAGGFDASDQLGTALPYLPESVTGYEAGLKMTFGRKATLNIAAFRSDFSDLQVQAFNGLTFITTNAAKARSTGVEMDGRWQVSRAFQLSGSVAYTDAKYLSYTQAACTTAQTAAFTAGGGVGTCFQNLSGRPLTDAPKWSSSVNLKYATPVSGDWMFEANAGMNYRSSHFVAPDLDPLGLQKGYGTFNGSIAVIAPSDSFSLTLLAKNIFDVRAKTFVVNAPLFNGTKSASIIEPRTFEVRATVRF